MEIKLISQDGCNPCKHVKNLLDAEGVFYDYLNITQDESITGKYGIMGTPVTILFDGEKEIQRVHGYDIPKLHQLIQKL
ncbi:glutaredoxin family protein [Lysinibacillus sp. Bpr_S20]|uniref:glutaredoxin family protein n=1 Tax=Lysinibacillus sp. Bpr_S20 TaxID=2933964 RepID=UPI0020122A42|nr:glutaredoxin family protein [Lysinibacillus sp. Bpr_S20]MCL1700699.1 glutaredoxin family protein [Lysinibacillus sp. Bpr_S20]